MAKSNETESVRMSIAQLAALVFLIAVFVVLWLFVNEPAKADEVTAEQAAKSVVGVDDTSIGGARLVLTNAPCNELDAEGDEVKASGLAVIITPDGSYDAECFYTGWRKGRSNVRYIVVSLQRQGNDKHLVWVDPGDVNFTDMGIHWMIKQKAAQSLNTGG
jgi:hypothetical protein